VVLTELLLEHKCRVVSIRWSSCGEVEGNFDGATVGEVVGNFTRTTCSGRDQSRNDWNDIGICPLP